MASFSSIGVGLGGNVDVNALIKASVDAVKLPITRPNGLNYQAKLAETKISTFGQLKSLVSTLQTAASKLSSITGWNAVQASSSDDKSVSATAVGGTVETTFSVTVQQLARAQVSTSDGLPAGQAVGAGTLTLQVGRWNGGNFTEGGTPALEVSVGAGDTLADIAGKINGAGAAVTATILTDADGQRLMLRSKATGEEAGFQLSVTDTDGDPGAGLSRLAAGLSTDPGAGAAADALAQINGQFNVRSATNTFENAVAGVTFKAEKVSSAPVELSVTKNSSAVQKNIEDFVLAYNAVNQALNDLTKFDKGTGQGGLLQGDSTVVGLQNSLRNVVESLSSSTGPFQRLSDIGLGKIQGGDLSIDSTKLSEALKNPDALKALFIGADGLSTTEDGVGEKIKAATSKLLSAEGFFAYKDAQLKDVLKRNADEIKRVNARADSTEALLSARYTALDSQMSKLNALNAYIAQQVTTWNNNKG
ncbi:flagellar hook-associated protein 2 [Oryzisolibacter propanilivorax]|uniref:Flagellar hook-associated protein 2 n=1 Tax=Oryzisolibacter propanilivorax TaxID=1527607 RepID=A0A1G9V4E5_9BURK|nr:flagellar filament capping protein FliD [Oryzisolibacter propanilivorax]SDM66963.1 flagellar hook-associated protein 2 [Oryzisolibacter propanilivorax]